MILAIISTGMTINNDKAQQSAIKSGEANKKRAETQRTVPKSASKPKSLMAKNSNDIDKDEDGCVGRAITKGGRRGIRLPHIARSCKPPQSTLKGQDGVNESISEENLNKWAVRNPV